MPDTPFEQLLTRIAAREARIGVIGLGYVGIPLAREIVYAGFVVTGFDILPDRVAQLDRNESPIRHVPGAEIAWMRANGFDATTDMARAAECDALIICVPTPLSPQREPDLSFVMATMAALTPFLRPGQAISLESTTWPGTTEEALKPVIETAGLTVGEETFLIYSPERENPGDDAFTAGTIPKVVSGATSKCRAIAEALYGAFIDRVVPVSSTGAAEMVKLLENIHRSVNIGLVNEMKLVAEAMGLDIFEIVDAAATKPFGFTPYYPGPGVGGHCIPVDPFYLTWKAREYGLDTRFIRLAGDVNSSMPDYVAERVVRALNSVGKAASGARVLALGIAYKPEVADPRESASIEVMERMRDWGVEIRYSDPHIPVFPAMRRHRFDLESVALDRESIAENDAVLLLTDHAAFDYAMIAEVAPLIIDTRGRFDRDDPKVWRA